MSTVMDEQDVKRDTLFPEYEVGDSGNILILRSKLCKVTTHFMQSVNKYVLCKEAECLYCQANYPKVGQYYYAVDLNGVRGFLDIKASVFFNIQGISKAQRKDARSIAWTVIKQGAGRDTEYMTSKCDNLPQEDFDRIQAELEENTRTLVDYVESQEARLEENYTKYMGDIKQQPLKTGKKSTTQERKAALEAQAPSVQKIEEEVVEDANYEASKAQPVDTAQDVQPEDIPF